MTRIAQYFCSYSMRITGYETVSVTLKTDKRVGRADDFILLNYLATQLDYHLVSTLVRENLCLFGYTAWYVLPVNTLEMRMAALT